MIKQAKKISVLGISGSGKTTISRELSKKLSLPVYHMDTLFWKENWTEVPEAEWQKAEFKITEKDTWIIEGYIDADYYQRLDKSDIIIYIDLKGYKSALNVLTRWWKHRINPRSELKGCPERLDLVFLYNIFFQKERKGIEQAILKSDSNKVIRLKNREEIREFLDAI